jgi:hypothetical protein
LIFAKKSVIAFDNVVNAGVKVLNTSVAAALKDIGIKYLGDHPKSSPIPWFNRHVDINKKQTALQENESTNYVIGVMSDNVSYDELPDL